VRIKVKKMQNQKTKKRKILYFVEAFGGGIFTYLCNLSNQLCNDFDIYIAYGIRKQTPKNFERYFNKNVHLIRVNNYQREVSLSKDLAAFKEMKAVIKRVQPDLVHLNSSKAGILGRLLLKNSEIPVFYTPHGYSFLMTDISKKKRFFYKSLEKIFAFRNIETIACSKSEYEITKHLTYNSTYVDNGINLNEFKNIKINFTEPKLSKNIVVATLGRISIQKNPQLFNKIAMAFPDFEFMWIGDGELRSELTAPNITITGWINNNKALAYLNKCNIFLLPSLWEGLPMALLEAMYLKKICIVSNVVGNKDTIVNGKNGYICDNLDEFVKKINAVVNQGETKNIVDQAHDEILMHYSAQVMANGYKEIYMNSLGKRK